MAVENALSRSGDRVNSFFVLSSGRIGASRLALMRPTGPFREEVWIVFIGAGSKERGSLAVAINKMECAPGGARGMYNGLDEGGESCHLWHTLAKWPTF